MHKLTSAYHCTCTQKIHRLAERIANTTDTHAKYYTKNVHAQNSTKPAAPPRQPKPTPPQTPLPSLPTLLIHLDGRAAAWRRRRAAAVDDGGVLVVLVVLVLLAVLILLLVLVVCARDARAPGQRGRRVRQEDTAAEEQGASGIPAARLRLRPAARCARCAARFSSRLLTPGGERNRA